MASGGGAAGGCSKRCRRAAADDSKTSRRNKRCAGGEDYMYEYGEEAEKIEGDAEPRYVVLTEDDVRARQEADTAKVAEVLAIPTGFAAVLLRHFKWRVGRVQEEWFSDDRRVRAAVGLPADVPDARSPRPQVCGICFDLCPAGRTRSAGCSHYYCDGCWRGYVAAAVRDGPRCLSLRCPDPSCSAPVVRELVDAVAAAADKARYARFWLRSYVEESGGRLRWCGGGAGCTRSVEFLGDDTAATDVFCGCRRGFCWTCGEEAHRPVSCGTVRAWLAKNASDSATGNWVVANTKRCPACRRPIEKNQGCNHMTCGAPCRHQFCWLCLDPWDDHRGCGARSDYRRRRLGKAAATDEQETRRRQAKASLDRYLYHYERWAASGKSLHKALADMDELERSELERMARAVDLPVMEIWFVTEAYRQIADGRRVLRWAHAYAYFLEDLDPERHAAKRGLFDDLQSEANRWLECLHASAELERRELFGADGGGESTVDAKTFMAYREKVANLTGVTRMFLGNLVRAFETNLPEVVTPAFEQIVNEPTIGSQTVGLGGIVSTPATVIAEPAAIEPIVSAPRFLQVTPISNVASQGLSAMQTSSSSPILHEANAANDSVQEHKPIVNPVRPGGHGSLLSNPSQFRLMNSAFLVEATTSMGLPNIWATPLQVQMLNMMSNGVTSTPSVNSSVSEPGQPIGTQQMVQRTALGSFGSNPSTSSSNIGSSSSRPNNMGMDQRAGFNSLSVTNNSAQQPPPKYVKIWEGSLVGQRQGQPVFICKLESWRGTTCKTSIADWPETMQIVRLIAQEHMTNKQYVGKTDFLIFRTLNQHGFLQQLQEKKLCAVIQLPSQTLLLSMSDKAGRMIGMLFRENTLVFKPQVLIQSSPMQQEKLQQQQQQQQQLQLQQQEQPELLQQQRQEKMRQLQQLQPKHQQQHMQVLIQNILTQQLRNQQNLPQTMQHQQQLWQFMQQQQHQQQMQQPSYQMVVHFRSLEKPKDDDFSLELSKLHTYDDVVERVARQLELDDPAKIRLTSHNCYSQQPKPQPVKYRGVEHLLDMLIHYNQTSDILYYEVLDIPLPELQCLKTLKVAFHHPTKDEVVIHSIRLPKNSTIADVINDLKTKVELSSPNAELRVLEVFYHKIYKIFPLQERIENINDQYWTLRAEEIPEEEKNIGPNDRLIHVYHFMKDINQTQQIQNFGDPFFLLVHEGETLAEVKKRIQTKLQVSADEFSKWKFAFISMNRPDYLQDSDVILTRFQRREVYGAWEQYLGMEHTDTAPKRAYTVNQSRHSYEKPVKIYN